MINFFRKTRKNLADKNKPMKYMRYAVGEIVLVMIGILLALQVNTWNEGKKATIKFNKSLVNILNDLEIDLERAKRMSINLSEKRIISDSVINGKYSVSDYRSNPSLFSLALGFPDFLITDTGFKTLMQKPEIIPDEYAQLINTLNSQYITINETLKIYILSSGKNIEDTHLRYTLNFPWYSQKDSVSIEKRIQYYVNNPIYKNEVAYYKSTVLGDYLNGISQFYSQGLFLYLTIKTIIKDTSHLPSFFPKNADNYDSVKHDYLGKYLTKSGVNLFIEEKNGFLIIDVNGAQALLTLISEDKFKYYNNAEWTLIFKRDKSNKIISFSNGINTVNKV